MRETSIQRAVLARMRKTVGGKWQVNCPSPYTNSGRPDIDGCVSGLTIKIETKRPKEKPRPDQEAELRGWAKAGAMTHVIHSLEECDELITRIQHAIRR